MAVLVSLQPSVTENPLDTIWNSCHYQFKIKKNHKNAYLPNMRIFGIYVPLHVATFPNSKKEIVSFHYWLFNNS